MVEAHPLPTNPRFQDLTGSPPINNLKVVAYAGKSPSGKHLWHCRCLVEGCGRMTIVTRGNLMNGHTKSCSCIRSAACRAARTVHGFCRRNARAREYNVWGLMLNRCNNEGAQDYHNYGGRGIKVCERWHDFRNFIADMGPRPSPKHTIERKDNDGDYEPSNCRWATRAEQNNNSRNNRRLTHNGETHTVAEWSRILGLPRAVISQRLSRGWTEEEALITPLRRW